VRTVIRYPNKEHPECEGVCFVDEVSDPDVTYMHYKDFKRPGWPKPRTFIVEVEKATGRAREIRELPMHFPVSGG
jgi:hypothetical protein